MNYPVWHLPQLGGGLIIAIIAILHVVISHLAVGGGLFLVLTERKAVLTKNKALLEYVRKHTWFFLLLTFRETRFLQGHEVGLSDIYKGRDISETEKHGGFGTHATQVGARGAIVDFSGCDNQLHLFGVEELDPSSGSQP